MTQLRDDLNAVAGVLEQGWCQRAYARDAQGKMVTLRDETACCYCLSAAVELTADFSNGRAVAMYQAIANTLGLPLDRIVPWQDERDRTKAEVIYIVRMAAEAAS